jgi:hypothetical protein
LNKKYEDGKEFRELFFEVGGDDFLGKDSFDEFVD